MQQKGGERERIKTRQGRMDTGERAGKMERKVEMDREMAARR